MLRKSSEFTITAILTLALGIGANTAVFSLVNSFLLRPLPYPHAERLVKVWEQLRVLGINRFAAPVGDFVDYRKDNHVFEDMAAAEDGHFLLTTDQLSQRVFALKVTANFFEMMALHPAIGRSLVDTDNQPGHEHVIVLSDAVWRENFGADSNLLGKNVTLDGQIYEVVGVMPRGLRFSIGQPDPPDVWVPLSLVPASDLRSLRHQLPRFSRLCSGSPHHPRRLSAGSLFAGPQNSALRSHDHPPRRMTASISGMFKSLFEKTSNKL